MKNYKVQTCRCYKGFKSVIISVLFPENPGAERPLTVTCVLVNGNMHS
jgi:hypothetical protein